MLLKVPTPDNITLECYYCGNEISETFCIYDTENLVSYHPSCMHLAFNIVKSQTVNIMSHLTEDMLQ